MLRKFFYYGCSALLNRVFGLLPLKEDRVLFLSDVRCSLSGNFEPVSELIAEDYEIRTSLKEDRRIRHSLKEYLQQCFWLATSKYVLLDDYAAVTAYMHVRKGQELVQLWHGSGAFKRFGFSRNGDISRVHPGYRRYTKAIVSSEAVRPCYAEAFSIPMERVIASGNPRTDVFFDEDHKAAKRREILAAYPTLERKKVILFAPTYRGARVEDADYDFGKLDPERLREALGDDYVLLVKWHPALYENLKRGKVKGWDTEKYGDFVIDVSEEREVNDFLFAADLLITDYSSVIFEWALLDRPIVYFVYDLEEYDGGRGLFFPFKDYVYGEMARNMEELIRAVQSAETDEEKRRKFIDRFVSANDGHAAEKTVKAVFGKSLQGKV